MERLERRLEKRYRRVRNQKSNQDHLNYSTVEISQHTWKSPGDQMSLAVIRTSAKVQQQTIGEKSRKEQNNNNNNNTHKLLWDLDIQTDLLISARRPDLIKICKIVDFAVPADHRIKLKECEKRDKYLDLARELKKLWNMKVTIIPIVIGVFGTVK